MPVVYFLEPSEENIFKLVNDIRRKLYSQIYVNFTGSVDSNLLKTF